MLGDHPREPRTCGMMILHVKRIENPRAGSNQARHSAKGNIAGRCFHCGEHGHPVRDCKDGAAPNQGSTQSSEGSRSEWCRVRCWFSLHNRGKARCVFGSFAASTQGPRALGLLGPQAVLLFLERAGLLQEKIGK